MRGLTNPDAIDRTAREAFGFEDLRPGQREAIGELLKGRDTLAVLASGAGKSRFTRSRRCCSSGRRSSSRR